jgi:DNA gyrase subunit B
MPEPIKNKNDNDPKENISKNSDIDDNKHIVGKTSTDRYDASDIQVLKGLEGVRKRPSMYIGSTHKEGWHHLVWEVVDNSIDEVLNGDCDKINISLNRDGSVTVEDNGRGIPTDIHPEYGIGSLEVIIQHLHAGGKFNKGSYKISGGLHGVGISVVAACSELMQVEVFRDKKYYVQNFGKGKILSKLKTTSIEDYLNSDTFKKFQRFEKENGTENGFSKENNVENGFSKEKLSTNDEIDDDIGFRFELGINGNISGTRITFYPDDEIFTKIHEEPVMFDFAIINKRLRNLAYLNPNVEIEIFDEYSGKSDEHHYEGGIKEFVEYLNRSSKVRVEEPIYFHKNIEDVDVEVALQYTESYLENIITFVNNVSTLEGGTHLTGFKTSLTRVINNYVKNSPHTKKISDVSFLGSDVREGITVILSVKVMEPQFEGQTKTKLGNEEVQRIVSQVMADQLGKFLEENPKVAKTIIEKCLVAQKARIASKKARDLTRRKSAMDPGRLPGKLADCTSKDPVLSELFIVEGSSAGGSAKQGRNREFQAILPLRGKILNVEKARQQKVEENKEIKSMISAIGTGVYTNEESNFKIEKIRYHKIIIMCDADVDGHHIETLLLTFFFRYLRPLIDKGFIYVAVPPLFLVKYKKTSNYIFDEKDLAPYLDKLKEEFNLDDQSKIKIQRFKGLGEMNPDELWETTMDPSKRRLLKIMYDDFTDAHQLFNTLMGIEVAPRKEFIIENYRKVQNLDV